MGIIARRFEERAVGPIRDWLHDDEEDAELTIAGTRVNRRTALSLSTIWRCVDLLASAVALAPKDVVVKVGGRSFPEFTPPRWLSEPNPTDPTYTIDDYFNQVALSILLDGNYFVHAFPFVWEVEALTVLDPNRVTVKPGPKYEVRDEKGRVVSTLGPMEVLHGTWIRLPGELRGISPLEALRRGIGSAIAAEEFGGRFFGQGAALSFGVEVPYQMDNTKLNNLRESLRQKHAGLHNSHAIGILADGGKFVTGLAPTPEQAQMLATRKFSVEDLCRPYGVPPQMAGSQEPGAASYASALVWKEEFRDSAVLPLTARLERQHRRLLTVPPNITDPRATIGLQFNLDWVARVNLLERAQAHEVLVRGGIKTPNEARAKEDLPPLNGGDELYMQQQMVPISRIGQEPEAA